MKQRRSGAARHASTRPEHCKPTLQRHLADTQLPGPSCRPHPFISAPFRPYSPTDHLRPPSLRLLVCLFGALSLCAVAASTTDMEPRQSTSTRTKQVQRYAEQESSSPQVYHYYPRHKLRRRLWYYLRHLRHRQRWTPSRSARTAPDPPTSVTSVLSSEFPLPLCNTSCRLEFTREAIPCICKNLTSMKDRYHAMNQMTVFDFGLAANSHLAQGNWTLAQVLCPPVSRIPEQLRHLSRRDSGYDRTSRCSDDDDQHCLCWLERKQFHVSKRCTEQLTELLEELESMGRAIRIFDTLTMQMDCRAQLNQSLESDSIGDEADNARFSRRSDCDKCQAAYSTWLMTDLLQKHWTIVDGVPKVCPATCQAAELYCSHMRATNVTDYAGFPSFRCIDSTTTHLPVDGPPCIHPCEISHQHELLESDFCKRHYNNSDTDPSVLSWTRTCNDSMGLNDTLGVESSNEIGAEVATSAAARHSGPTRRKQPILGADMLLAMIQAVLRYHAAMND